MLNRIPQISVIVPVYNVEAYIERCIDSILSQSFIDFELILIDDGSQDNSGNICDKYSVLDERVRVKHKPNGGVSSARNFGLDIARGEWIAFVDSDDYIDVDYLAELVTYSKLDDVDFIVTLNTIRNYTQEKYIVLSPNDLNLFSLYKFQDYGQPWGKLFRREIIYNKSLRYNPRVHIIEDLMFALLYLREVKEVVLLTSKKYFYEVGRENSLTKRMNSYETELVGKIEFDRIAELYIKLNGSYALEMANTQVFLTERTINAIMCLPERRERLQKIKSLDITVFLKFRKSYCILEFVLFSLLRLRMYRLHDLLFHLTH